MSYMERVLRGELQALNDKIDDKIYRGLSYSKEAARHKYIVRRLGALKKESRHRKEWAKPFWFSFT